VNGGALVACIACGVVLLSLLSWALQSAGQWMPSKGATRKSRGLEDKLASHFDPDQRVTSLGQISASLMA